MSDENTVEDYKEIDVQEALLSVLQSVVSEMKALREDITNLVGVKNLRTDEVEIVDTVAKEVVEKVTDMVETPLVPVDHKYVVLRNGDYSTILTENGREINNIRASFENEEDAREFANMATERPIYVGLVERADDKHFTRLKYVYQDRLTQ